MAPERFANERFLAMLERTPISLFAVDEAHSISEWGHNFRPDYLKIAPMEHINGFTPQTMRGLAERLGFVQVSPATAHVTAVPLKVLKNEIRRLAGRWMKPTTQLYFRKL